MKKIKTLAGCILAAMTIVAMTGCDDGTTPDMTKTVIVAAADLSYDQQGVWTDQYEDINLQIGDAVFTHSAPYAGYEYWEGFCASRSHDTADHSAEGWLPYQCCAITGGGVAGAATPYIVGYWSEWSPKSNIMSLTGGTKFKPQYVYVTNTAWTYYAMKEGCAPARKFGSDDYLRLTITGLLQDIETGSVTVDLGLGQNLISQWTMVSLEALGEVDQVMFTMSGSDQGAYGINTPTYFAIDHFTYAP